MLSLKTQKMAALAGNLSSRISSQLQYRVFFIPWVKKNNAPAITCLQSRDYSSSVPVRYIPKKSSKVNKPESPLPIKGSKKPSNRSDTMQRSEVSDEDKSRYHNQMFKDNVLLDDFERDYEFMEETEEVIEKSSIHQRKDSKQDVSCAFDTKQDAEKLAIELLATRAFTAVEMRKKLHGKGFSPDTVESVIDDFQRSKLSKVSLPMSSSSDSTSSPTRKGGGGFINDSLYAETFSRSRWSSSSWGPRRINQALLRKGVSEVDAENAVKMVFEKGESSDHESSLGLSKTSVDHLFIQASKQWLRGQDVPKEKRKSRIIRWLQYRGFNWGVISIILKKLESQHPP